MKGGPQKVTPPLPFTKAISRDVSPPGRCQRSQGHTGAAMARPALLCLDRAPGPGRESLREEQESGGHGSFRPRVRRARPTPAGGRPLTLRLPPPAPAAQMKARSSPRASATCTASPGEGQFGGRKG